MKQPKSEFGEKKFSLLDESKKIFESRFYDSFFVNEYGRLETVRSERYGVSFSIIVLQIESFYNGTKVPPKKELLEFFKKFVTVILEVVRNCDVVGMIEDKKIVVVLPHTDYFGSLIAIKKLSKALEPLTTKGEPYASIIISRATYPTDGKGYGELVSIASKRLLGIRESIWEKLKLNNKFFWEIIATLTEGSFESLNYATFDAGPNAPLNTSFVQRINEVIIQEILRTPQKRGILYVGTRNISNNMSLKKQLESAGKTSMKVFIVGEGREGTTEIKNATTIGFNDTRFSSTYFTFLINEDFSYALICKEGWGDIHTCFHTSDPYFVEGIITKFQRDYALQENL